VQIVDVYKVNNNSWSKAVHLPQSLHHSNTASSLINSNIYVIGGDEPSKTFNNNKKKYYLKKQTDNWTPYAYCKLWNSSYIF
jgi:N-acetylneuraminic acid mutarotase